MSALPDTAVDRTGRTFPLVSKRTTKKEAKGLAAFGLTYANPRFS
jgi:hypothetical protein